MKIKTLFLDIGEVLVTLHREAPLRIIEQRTGFSQQEIRRRLDSNPNIRLYESGELSTEAFYRRATELFEMPLPLEEFKQIWSNIFTFGDHHPSLCSSSLFHELRQGRRMVALSNTNEMHFEYLMENCPLLHDFDDYVLSYQVGSMKPDKRIYETALERAHCEASETLFIDDRPENIEAGEHLGIRGVLFVGEAELRRTLTDLKVLPGGSRGSA